MPNNFEKDKERVLNKLWSMVPSWLRPIVVVVVIGSIAWFGVIKFLGGNGQATQTATQEKAAQAEPCRFFVEVLANVQELGKAISNYGGSDFSINQYHFIDDDYKRYDPKFDSPELDTQIKNLYINLRKIPYGGYSKGMLVETKSQGEDILNRLSVSYGCKDYFEGKENHAASGSTLQARTGHAVSADASAVGTVDYREAGK